MRMYDIIAKKRHGLVLDDDEIKFFVDGYTRGDIPDYQASALCMAICLSGMTDEESARLTYHMMHSGDTVDLSSLTNTVDKHSTGGVGDLTSLVVAPTAASLGLTVAKMSGRGLGHTGGTIDKLESIPGFRTSLSSDEFYAQVRKIGVAVIGQTADLAPADKKLYALRDVTATIDAIPLIASSIMSKKLAAGSETIVLDVKYGSGAFMKTPEDAQKLARLMVNIGKSMGRNMAALVTSMDYPLGRMIGNSLEIIEAAKILRGELGGDALTVSLALISNLLSLSKGIPLDKAEAQAEDEIRSGRAYEKFLEWVTAQGGDASAITENRLEVGKCVREVRAEEDGYVLGADTERIGLSSCMLGAGRVTKDDVPDLSAGLVLHVDQGQNITRGDVLATLYASDEEKLAPAEEEFRAALKICSTADEAQAAKPKLIYDVVR